MEHPFTGHAQGPQGCQALCGHGTCDHSWRQRQIGSATLQRAENTLNRVDIQHFQRGSGPIGQYGGQGTPFVVTKEHGHAQGILTAKQVRQGA